MKKIIILISIICIGIIAAYYSSKTMQPDSTKEQKTLNVYFIKVRSGNNSQYVAVKRKYKNEEQKFKTAIKELFKGPNKAEKNEGLYSAIPEGAKILSLKETSTKAVIDLSPHFEYGGGTTSMIQRIDQLVKTSIDATNKPVFLEIEGETVEAIGGEGIIIEQPLAKNLKHMEQ